MRKSEYMKENVKLQCENMIARAYINALENKYGKEEVWNIARPQVKIALATYFTALGETDVDRKAEAVLDKTEKEIKNG